MTALLQDGKLWLPKLQKGPQPSWAKLKLSESRICIPIDTEFETVWQSPTVNPESLSELTRRMIVLCKTICNMIKTGQGQVKVATKTSPRDLVTEMDSGIEMILRLWLKTHYPTHKIIGEEGFKDSFSPEDTVWYIDPVDGTSNFVEGRDDVSLHVGCFKQGEPLLCLIGAPLYDELYVASADHPDLMLIDTSELVLTPKKVTLPDLLPLKAIGTEYMETQRSKAAIHQKITKALGLPPHRVRSIGINILNIVKGINSVFFKPGAKPWDILPPLGLVQLAYGSGITTEIWFPTSDQDHMFRPDMPRTSLFSRSLELHTWFSKQLSGNCRMGLVLAYPTEAPEVRERLLPLLNGVRVD